MNEESYEFYVAGVKFHNLKDVEDSLEEGDHLTLVPEPDNQYDPNAVKILFGPAVASTMLGYVPQKGELSSKVKAMLEVYDNVVCELIEFSPTAKPWQKLKVAVHPE